MEKLLIHGGRRLCGTVEIAGSKNAALPIMAGCLLSDAPVVLSGVPCLADVDTLSRLLDSLGLSSVRLPGGSIRLQVNGTGQCEADPELVRRMRASFCVLGPLVARRGHAQVALPGGCRIGGRPVDLHLKGLAALGAEITIDDDRVTARARRLKGASINLWGPSGSTVTGTCNVMSAAVLASGDTWIDGAAREPEVVDLGRFLCRLGARIDGLGTSRIRIRGVTELGGASYQIIPDRIEAATFMTAVALTRGELKLNNVRRNHLTAVIANLRRIGLSVDHEPQALVVRCDRPYRPTNLETAPYPGLPTDVQAQLTALLSVTSGTSRVRDLVFPERFHHVAELRRLGAQIRLQGDEAQVTGVPVLHGAEVTATDLRASAALVLAGLAARGQTIVRRIEHLDRGYEQLDSKLRAIGADVSRYSEETIPERRAA